MAVYDHRRKAGNPADVIKHVALLAALESILTDFSGNRFTYADIFAGFAYSQLTRGNEWEQGIARLAPALGASRNPHVRLWYNTCVSGALKNVYPGSSVIASDAIKRHGKQARLLLWEISRAAEEDLRKHLLADARISLGLPDPFEIRRHNADFLFIDPPGVASRRHPGFPQGSYIESLLVPCPAPTLLWLPLETPARDLLTLSTLPRDGGAEIPITELYAAWSENLGCRLVCRLPETAFYPLLEAVKTLLEESPLQPFEAPGSALTYPRTRVTNFF
jgi:hypothetical protein